MMSFLLGQILPIFQDFLRDGFFLMNYRVIFLTGFAPKSSKCWEWQNPYQKSKSEPIQQQDVKF